MTPTSSTPERASGATAAAGLSRTAERVLVLLREADRPVKAYDLMSLVEPGRLLSPPTVYRALKRLVDVGLAHRVHTLDAFVPCRLLETAHEPAFLLCDVCERFDETPLGPAVREGLRSADTGFAPRAIALEARGSCSRCR